MQNIPLQKVPNQEINILLDDNNYDIVIHDTQYNSSFGTSIMAVDITINNEIAILGSRACTNCPIIPFLNRSNGNFVIVTQNDQYPNWRLFGVTQFLIYMSQAELEAITNG
jgi:hypothetical protein